MREDQEKEERECDCGEPLTHHKQTKCQQCRMAEDPRSSQCAFCMEHYLTHAGSRGSKKEMLMHVNKRCLRRE